LALIGLAELQVRVDLADSGTERVFRVYRTEIIAVLSERIGIAGQAGREVRMFIAV
jgi:hypothetical protein